MREALCWLGEARWPGKKDRFRMALSCAGLKYPHKLWTRILKTKVEQNMISTLNVMEMVTLTRMQRAGRIP